LGVGNTRKTRAQQFAEYLRGKGWTVYLKTKGRKNVDHDKKQLLFQNILREGKDNFGSDKHDYRFPVLRINAINCAPLWTSMANCPAKTGGHGQTIKDKSAERKNSKVLPQHAPHLSDALDALVWGLFAQLLRAIGVSLPDSTFS
jgi:hypothetical protein